MHKSDNIVRKYAGEADGQWLADFLNRTQNRRIARLVENLARLCGSVRSRDTCWPAPDVFETIKKKHPRMYKSLSIPELIERGLIPPYETDPGKWVSRQMGREYDVPAISAASRLLARFSFRPHFGPHASDSYGETRGNAFTVEFIPARLLTAGKKITLADLEGAGREQESFAVLRLIQLTQTGLIWKVRKCKCEDCGKWFCARKADNFFHTTTCQQAFYRSSSEWKAHRRDYMKDYYWRNRSKNQPKGVKANGNN